MKSLFTFLLLAIISTFSFCQSNLVLSSCEDLYLEINDNTDIDGDGDVCEVHLNLQNIAMHADSEACSEEVVDWRILIDVDDDGVYDLEYSSELPSTNTTLDDTNGNGIPDLYISSTVIDQPQMITVNDIQGPNASIKVRWQAVDQCGFIVDCVQSVFVEDKTAPIPYCISALTYLYDGWDLELWASDFNLGSFDNCTSSSNLKMSFSADTNDTIRPLTCLDVINSPVSIEIYVTDQAGNHDSCQVLLTAIPGETVDCFGVEFIDGYVLTEDGQAISDAEVSLTCNVPDCNMVTYTDEDGYYSFTALNSLFMYSGRLSVKKEAPYNSDVSMLDLIKIQRHILGIESFTTVYQQFAADVNRDGNIKASDLTLLRKLVLGVITELPHDSSLHFFDKNLELDMYTDLMDLWGDLNDFNDDNPLYINIEYGYKGTYDFVGVKIGNIVD